LKNNPFLVVLLIALAVGISPIAPAVTEQTSSNIYYRPFNLVYANQGGKTIPEDDSTIIDAFESFPLKPTMITDVLLNEDPDGHTTFISSLKEITRNLCFALGKQNYVLPDDHSRVISLATKYAKYTRCIRIDHFQWLVEKSGDEAVRSYLVELHNLGFQHIMVNPWQDPQSGNGWPYVDATQIAVDKDTWKAKTDAIHKILAQSPSVTVIVNYENPGGQDALAALGAQASIAAMTIAADNQNSSPVPYRWMPPWSHNYDPYQLGTLSWEANKLAQIDPQTAVTTTATSGTGITTETTTKRTSTAAPIPGFPLAGIVLGLIIGVLLVVTKKGRRERNPEVH